MKTKINLPFLALAVLVIGLAAVAPGLSTDDTSSQVQYYISDWRPVRPDNTEVFVHGLPGQPEFVDVCVAMRVDMLQCSPIAKYPALQVLSINHEDIRIVGGLGDWYYVRVSAIYVPE